MSDLRSEKTINLINKIDDFVKNQSSNSANTQLLNNVVDVLRELNFRMEEVERESMPSQSFISPLDGGPSRIMSI